jgi:hypothetical protein
LQYIASYTDLMNGFGANAAAGNVHYMLAGRFEGAPPPSTDWRTSLPMGI